MVSKKLVDMQNELKSIREKERQKERDDYHAQVLKDRAAARAAYLDKIVKSKTFIDPQTGREVTWWDDANRKADAAMGADVMSYNDWRAAMMSLLSMFSSLNKAINHSLPDVINPSPLDVPDIIAGGTMHYVIFPVKDWATSKFSGNPEVDLPALQHLVEFSDDKKLKVGKLVRADSGLDLGRLDGLFQSGVELWLKEQGYTKHPEDLRVENPRFLDINGTQLDKAAFDALKADPTHGLEHFLREGSDLIFTHQGPRP